ncbi:Golgi membrane protein 1 [Takifugu flavidus]|uniref:Golgi membrane protein 1 n=1 Tax=Takifugu flavidus TaxID=433684 RepID=A0A5C6MZR9_9TELE|nr:Golgi membrane protein 1 [Takifugu flavidus]XP_056887999.1 Golgi membrane protein 1 [Takifugu flavidus]XP_056888000.1 Golgi membrane protein 1 [Takifugu flavidus]XP_056888002.1 Golgi membrane protein 1 [Takifugu flavidus]TWW60503.1 Golgi membrane protein 1 [Takifugu flavidus]
MGALGNGRRGGRSPPLLIGALIACILVLGFNYWVSSSRNLELQTKLYDLESQVRRGAAERGAAEMKKNAFQDELQRQKEHMEHMESFYKKQLEGTQNTCTQEKGTLQKNISSSTKTVQQLKGQLSQLNNDLGKLQKELQNCQGNIKTLNKKLIYDMTHCNAELKSQKEQCDSRVAAAESEAIKKLKNPPPPPEKSSQLENTLDKVDKVNEAAYEEVKAPNDLNQTASLTQTNENEALELLTNDVIVEKAKASSKEEPHSVPPAAADKADGLPPPPEGAVFTDEAEAEILKNNLAEDENFEVMDLHDEAAQTQERESDLEGILMSKNGEETPPAQMPDEPVEYLAEEQGVGVLNEEKQPKKQPEDIDLEQELSDYNGDDDNEGEFEADKQAQLAQN